MDKTIFGNGVLVDINTHRITVALKPEVPIPVLAIYKRIKKGGYDPVTMHLRLRGRVHRADDTIRLRMTGREQVFELVGAEAEDLAESGEVDIQVRLDARKIPELEDDEVIAVVVEKIVLPESAHE